jgi:hypothetical protein
MSPDPRFPRPQFPRRSMVQRENSRKAQIRTAIDDVLADSLARVFADAVSRTGQELQDAQVLLLFATEARATGLWRQAGERLDLVAFEARPDMSEEVQRGFVEATRSVPLTEKGLGIVKAALDRAPAVAREGDGSLGGSVTWLKKFGARQSLALPVVGGAGLVGVIAISTPEPFGEEDLPWRLLRAIAAAIGSAGCIPPAGK